ncbi:DUF2577 family protein [Pseudobacteroides cellulosolvens]|uniref:DUF2577 domain-containing protein n=1 Tax=Pseudobacteroides cellulosolvens ATCC 35603 = DSM 2933 TaxID=398512 RepID=A0A0L6JH25_9FIRM|nr:DUF2577 family protein [Pseudobacteroides cellulosolvens]KNY25010.1 Protein of unknown function, DUF2577 [Pseudobacteroides cellulosolvens ATCC 35603 = DSM 2933]
MFLPEIQLSIKNYLETIKLTDYVYGEITSLSPLRIKIDQKLELPDSVIILTSNVIEKKIIVGVEEITINEGLQINDKVILLRVEKGQKFIVLSKVV